MYAPRQPKPLPEPDLNIPRRLLDLVDRVSETARQSIQREEDTNIFRALIDAANQRGPIEPVQGPVESFRPIDPAMLETTRIVLENNNTYNGGIVITANISGDIATWERQISAAVQTEVAKALAADKPQPKVTKKPWGTGKTLCVDSEF